MVRAGSKIFDKRPRVQLWTKGQQMTRRAVSHHGAFQALTFADGEHSISYVCFLVCRGDHGEVSVVRSKVWVGLLQTQQPLCC